MILGRTSATSITWSFTTRIGKGTVCWRHVRTVSTCLSSQCDHFGGKNNQSGRILYSAESKPQRASLWMLWPMAANWLTIHSTSPAWPREAELQHAIGAVFRWRWLHCWNRSHQAPCHGAESNTGPWWPMFTGFWRSLAPVLFWQLHSIQ